MATPSKVTMFNYFTKLPSKTCIVEENPRRSAPSFNKQHVDDFQSRIEQFDTELTNGISSSTNYISSLKSSQHKPYRVNKKLRGPLRAILIQFQEDVRPPYFGTWQKQSKLVTGRRPHGQDNEIFDYEVDSEAEWDIGGPGESLKGDDSDDEEEKDDYEIDMKTFVPHGYVSDDEVDVNSDNEENPSVNRNGEDDCDDEKDDSDSEIKLISEINVRRTEQPAARQQQAQPQQAVKQTPKMDIKPITLGINYEDNPSISKSQLEFLNAFKGVACGQT